MTKQQYADAAQALSPSLRRIALSILRSEHDAQDAVQQALLSVWAHRTHVDEARLKPYLTRTLINGCRDIQRMRQRVQPVSEWPEEAYTPPDRTLRDAVNQLPEALRTPLLLHYMEGYSMKEIASSLAITMPQLTGRMYRARRKLRQMLTQEVESDE